MKVDHPYKLIPHALPRGSTGSRCNEADDKHPTRVPGHYWLVGEEPPRRNATDVEQSFLWGVLNQFKSRSRISESDLRGGRCAHRHDDANHCLCSATSLALTNGNRSRGICRCGVEGATQAVGVGSTVPSKCGPCDGMTAD